MKKKHIILLTAAAVLSGAVILMPKGSENGCRIPSSDRISASSVSERTEYFASHGWEVEEVANRTVRIPEQFGEVYGEYAAMQDKQGMPLREYAGRDAQLYLYEVRNYSPENRKMFAELLVCDERAVASMVYSEDGGSIRSAVS